MKFIAYSGALALLLIATTVAAAPHANTAFITEYDLDKDGKVSLTEFDTERKIRFGKTDTDQNGTLSEAEYVGEYEARLTQELESVTDADKRKEQYQRQIRQAHVRFGVLNTSKNGQMTFGEYQVSGHNMFERHDVDKDGFVTTIDHDLLEKTKKDGKGGDFVQP